VLNLTIEIQQKEKRKVTLAAKIRKQKQRIKKLMEKLHDANNEIDMIDREITSLKLQQSSMY